MPTSKGERGPSTWYWLKQFLRSRESHDEVLTMIEQHAEDVIQKGMSTNLQTQDKGGLEKSEEPINILCIDGGGAKGYAMISIVEELEALYEEQSEGEQSDFISKFDLIAGTSVGGCGALTMNQTSTTDDAIIKGTYFMDMAREHAFAHLNLFRLMFTGSATKAAQQPSTFSKKLYGEDTMLRNEIGLKAFAVSTAISDNEAKKGMKPKPFLLRTYDIPSEEHELFKGTSAVKLSDAIQGTSGAPVAFDRVRVKVDDEMYTLCDGGLSCNCPVGLALAEAHRLYPNRPFGCIVSIGLDPNQDRFAYRAIELARVKTPALHFQRICPLKALESASRAEVDIRKIAQLEQFVRDEIRNDSGVRLRLKKTIQLLLDSPNRRIIEGLEDQRRVFHSRKSPTRLKLQASFDEEFLRRQKIRKEVKEGTLARKNSRLRLSQVGDTFQDDRTDYDQARNFARKFSRSLFISMVYHPLYYIFGTILVTLLISLLCLFFSGFELATENKKGWKSRGTEIAKRGMQADILRNNTDTLFNDESGTKWDDITSNVVKGDFPLKEQLSRRFFLNSDQPSSIVEDSSESISCEAENWYSSADLYAKNNMIGLVQAKEISLLEPTSIHQLCDAESITLSVLEDDNFCDCDNCLPPLSLVRLVQNFLGTENRNCKDLSETYKNVQNEFTEMLAQCANEIKTNMGMAMENSTCPSEFSPHLLDSDFGVQGSNFLRYSLSVYPTSTTDALSLFEKEVNYGSGGDKIEITYETRFSEFEEYAIDRTIKPDLILAACSGCMVFVVICLHTRSLWLACVGIIQIVLAIPLSYACYRFIFGLRFFSLLNLIGFFISAALGADDLFVACDRFNEVKDRLGRNSPTELVASVAFPEAASAMFLTTATTSIAFFASCVSPVAPIFTFSIFCGLMVVFNYVLNIFLVFPALCLLDKWTKDGTNCFLRFEPICKNKHEDTSHSRLKRILNRYYSIMHRLRWLLLVSCIILFGFALQYALKISVPKNTSVQMLPDSHPLQILSDIDNEKLLSSTILRATTGSHLEIIFGITPVDTGERNYPDSLSTLELDNRFDPSSTEAQDYLVSFCDRLFELPFVYKSSEDFKCSINAFDSWLSEQSLLPTGSQDIDYITSCDNATSLPMQEESFHQCFIAWSKGTSDSSVLSWNGKVRTIIINLGTRVKFDTPLGETRLEWEKFEEFQNHELTLRSPSDLNFFHTSAIWWWNDTFQMMQSTGLSSLYIAISASAIIILLSSRSPFLAFASAISICFILATSTATLMFLGWELGFLEWICFAILVGLSADFVIHLSHSYSHSPGRLHRHTRTKAAILSMGEPIIGATITTLSVSFLMLFCKIVFFVKFAQLLIVTISFSLVGGLVFHSVLVDCFGPEDPLTTYNKLRGLLTFRESEVNGSNSGDANGKDSASSSHSSARDATVYDLSESMDRKRKVHFQTSQEVSDKDAKDNMDTTNPPNRQSTYEYDLGGKGVEEMNIKWSKSPADIAIRFKNFTESYRDGQVLEYGAFSELREVYNRNDNELYAAKIVSKDLIPTEDKESMMSEIQVLKTISHENIIHLFDYIQDSHRYYLIYDLHLGGNLFDRIATKQVYTENEARNVCKILFGVLHHLDLKGVVHRDLKPDNILMMDKVSDTNIKLAGFSFARIVAPHEYLKTQCGTPEFVSPEILYGLPYRTKVDMWSLGVILYILLAGYPPFMSQNKRDLFRKIKSGSVSFPDNYWDKISTEARMLVVGLLSVDPQQRFSASEAMKSKWMTCDKDMLHQSLDTNLFRSFQTKQKVRESIVMNVPKTKTTSLGQSWETENTEESKLFTEIQESLRHSIAMDSLDRARRTSALDSSSSFPSLKGSMKSIEEDNSEGVRESFYSHRSSLKRLSTSELEEFPC